MWKPKLINYSGPKYIAIADALCNDIRNNRLKPGEKLPPQRELSYELGINFGTVTKAYALVSERGLIRGEIGRGTFVRKDPPLSQTPWPKENIMPGRVDMRSDFPCSLAEDPIFRETFHKLGNHPYLDLLLQYQPGSSMPDHLEIAATWLSDLGMNVTTEQIIITNGALHGGFLSLLALTKPGDLLLSDVITSPAIRSIAAMLHLRLKPVAMDEHGMIPDDLEEQVKQNHCKALYLIPNFHNPTTVVLPLARREAIAEIAGRSGFYIIEDDVFGSLINKRANPVSSLIPHQSFYVTSFSKGIAPGLRVGYATVPERFYQRFLTGLKITSWMASPLMVEIISGWIKDGNAHRLVALQARKIAQRESIVRKFLKSFDVRSHPHCPHVWLSLPSSIRESEAVMGLSRRGIDVTPGEYFSVKTGFMPGCLRLCFGQIEDLNVLEKICRSIVRMLSEPPSMFGTDV